MNCEEIQEYLSALCDGERIPSEAAEHVGSCEACRARMNEYLKIGVELRRLASVEMTEEVQSGAWEQAPRKASNWWGKGWETMRIPRFAFALLLTVIAILGSSLVLVKVRAQAKGTVLMLTINLPSGEINRCALSLMGQDNWCAMMVPTRILSFKVLAHNEDQIELGVRTGDIPVPPGSNYTLSLDDVQKLPEKQYWYKPGENLEIDVPGWGTMRLTGELLDHMPPPAAVSGAEMDPKPGELQVISPLLLRDNKVLFDFEGSVVTGGNGARMYYPGKGLWILSLSPLEGATEARVNLNRVSFELNGHTYTFLMGAPITRSEHLWVLHDPKYEAPPQQSGGFIGGLDMAHYSGTNAANKTVR